MSEEQRLFFVAICILYPVPILISDCWGNNIKQSQLSDLCTNQIDVIVRVKAVINLKTSKRIASRDASRLYHIHSLVFSMRIFHWSFLKAEMDRDGKTERENAFLSHAY